MVTAFPQALGGNQAAYEALLAEMQREPQQPPPMFTPQQAAQRVGANNQQVELGLLGQLSPDQRLSGVGGQIFKQALSDRGERTTTRGMVDPLTGDVAVDPEYTRAQQEARRGRVLQQALGYESKRQEAADKVARDAARAEDREALARLTASLRQGVGADSRALRDQLTKAQIDATKARTQVLKDKAASTERKVRQLTNTVTTRADFLIGQLDLAEKRVSPTTTGLIGSQLRKIPNTDAYDLNRLVDTIKAGIGFSELQQMRIESPTGGALGQVAIKELDMLQATLGNLDTAQSPEEVKRVTKQIKLHLKNIKDTAASYRGEPPDEGGATDIAPRAPGTPPVAPDAAPVGAPGAAPVIRRRLVNGVLQ